MNTLITKTISFTKYNLKKKSSTIPHEYWIAILHKKSEDVMSRNPNKRCNEYIIYIDDYGSYNQKEDWLIRSEVLDSIEHHNTFDYSVKKLVGVDGKDNFDRELTKLTLECKNLNKRLRK